MAGQYGGRVYGNNYKSAQARRRRASKRNEKLHVVLRVGLPFSLHNERPYGFRFTAKGYGHKCRELFFPKTIHILVERMLFRTFSHNGAIELNTSAGDALAYAKAHVSNGASPESNVRPKHEVFPLKHIKRADR